MLEVYYQATRFHEAFHVYAFLHGRSISHLDDNHIFDNYDIHILILILRNITHLIQYGTNQLQASGACTLTSTID